MGASDQAMGERPLFGALCALAGFCGVGILITGGNFSSCEEAEWARGTVIEPCSIDVLSIFS